MEDRSSNEINARRAPVPRWCRSISTLFARLRGLVYEGECQKRVRRRFVAKPTRAWSAVTGQDARVVAALRRQPCIRATAGQTAHILERGVRVGLHLLAAVLGARLEASQRPDDISGGERPHLPE